MKTKLLLIAFTCCFGSAHGAKLVTQQPICKWSNVLPSVFSPDPKLFAESLLKNYSTLALIIPSPSPAEKEWLALEMKGDLMRFARASATNIYSQMQLEKYLAESIRSLENLSGRRTASVANSMGWSFFAAAAIQQSGSFGDHIKKLVDSNVIRLDSVSVFGKGDSSKIDDYMRLQELLVAEHILTCIMPQVTVQKNP